MLSDVTLLDTGFTWIAPVVGDVMTRLNSLPSDTMIDVVNETGSWMPLLTLLSARSTVARICTGPCGVWSPAWNETTATPCTVCEVTVTPVAEPLLNVALPALPMIWNWMLSTPLLPLTGSGINWPAPSRTVAVIDDVLLPPEPGR